MTGTYEMTGKIKVDLDAFKIERLEPGASALPEQADVPAPDDEEPFF